MTSYTITFDNDTLRVGFNNDNFAQGDRIVRDAAAQFDARVESGELQGGKLIKVNGKISLLVSYTLAHQLAHLYSAIAVFDPRLGYIVVKSDTPDYPLASRIDPATGEVIPCPDESPPSEPAFDLYWQGDILKAQLNGKVKKHSHYIVRDTHMQLQALIDAGQLPGGRQPLLINGRSPVAVGFTIACRVAHLYGTVAVFDPKIGERGLDKYVAVISHGRSPVGEVIDVEREFPLEPPRIKVAICGFPNTGKTCLHDGLKQALLKFPAVPDAYVISGCPDGEGAFYSETARRNPELARQLKDEYKRKFTPEFAAAKARDIACISNSLLVFDVGGKISPENRTILSQANHAVILGKSEAEVRDWQALCEELNLKVVAILYSDGHQTTDKLECESPILKGSVCQLDRHRDASERPIVQKLAQVLVNLTTR